MKNRDYLVSLAVLLVTVVLAVLPPLLQPINSGPIAEITSVTTADNADGPWSPVDLRALILPDDQAWLEVKFNIPGTRVLQSSPPVGLFLSGTFSANAYWNGKEISHKGRPGTAEMEIPGPVDTVFFLDKDNLVVGTNTLLLELSSHYRPANISTIIHGTNGSGEIFGLRLAPYSAEPRRSINYYVVPLLVLTLSTVAVILLNIQAYSHRRPQILPTLLMGAIIIAAAAEISRSFVAYPYQYHLFRISIISISVNLFFITLVLYMFQLAYKNIGWKLLVGIGIGLYLFSLLVSTITMYVYASLTFLATVIYCLRLKNYHVNLNVNVNVNFEVQDWRLLLALIFLLICSFTNDGIFFDRYLYIAITPLLSTLVWPSNGLEKTAGKVSPALNKLVLKSAGKQRLINVKDIAAVSGSGNYAEVTLIDGTQHLDDRPLKTFNKLLPANFYHCHRSHIINLECVHSLHSEGGGSYSIEMINEEKHPVSRQKIQALRVLIRANEASFAL